MPDDKTLQRFWSKVKKGDGCWEWTASQNGNGYGQFGIRHGHIILAHRFAYEVTKGPIPEGLDILHSCDNRPCVNPDHLRPGTAMDNYMDCKSRGRLVQVYGESFSNAKLTNAQVEEIRRICAAGEYRSYTDIGRKFGVGGDYISRIVRLERRKRG